MNINLKKGTLFLFQLINKFGLVTGMACSFKIQLGSSKKIRLKLGNRQILLRRNTSDLEVFKQVFIYEQYKVQFNFVPKIIIDGGGNIGLSALYFHSLFPNADLLVIEPDQDNFLILRENVLGVQKIKCIEGALWNTKTKLFLHSESNDNWSRTVSPDLDKASIEVPTFTIEELMNVYNIEEIDILKLDIESSEKYLFSGNCETWIKRVKVIIIELHDDMLEGCSMSFFSAINNSISNYRTSVSGENIIIYNEDLLNPAATK